MTTINAQITAIDRMADEAKNLSVWLVSSTVLGDQIVTCMMGDDPCDLIFVVSKNGEDSDALDESQLSVEVDAFEEDEYSRDRYVQACTLLAELMCEQAEEVGG